MEYLLFGVASLFGSVLAWRALKETCLLLILALGPLLGSSALVALANIKTPSGWILGSLLIGTAVLVALPGRKPPVWQAMSRWQGGLLVFSTFVVLVFTQYHQVHVLDGDRWLHDSQIVAFQRGIYPPVNPLFPDLAMNGHFGRDLLMATLTQEKTDPAFTTWWVTPLLQLSTFLTLFAGVRAFTASQGRGFLVASMVFFGMDCGFRVGLIDSYDGSNGLAYPHLVLLFYLMNKVLRGATWSTWLVAGVVLGTYQLVYMTNFALLLATGLALFALFARSRNAWIGLLVTAVLAMGLAVTEGGAFTDMAHRGLHPELERAEQNQGLRVSVTFPKEHMFQVLTSTAGYHRTSVAYRTSLFESFYRPPQGEGYLYIWEPRFLRTHWLPLYLAPLSLWLLRRSSLGMSFWLFAAISYVLPGLFYFGPIFESEYFRWEFSAAFGFAAALGLALGEWLEARPIRWRRKPEPQITFRAGSAKFLCAIAILAASLAAGEKLVNDAFIASQKKGYQWFPEVKQWRLNEPTFGLTVDIMEACEWLRDRTLPGQQVMTNFLNDRPSGLWPDVVTATLSGVFPAGHAYPSETEGGPHGNPAFHQNGLYRAFWASGDLVLLEGSKVRWLLADTGRLPESVVKKLKVLPHQFFGKQIIAVDVPVSEAPKNLSTHWSLAVDPKAIDNESLRLGSRFQVPVQLVNPGAESRATLVIDKADVSPLYYSIATGTTHRNWTVVTPLDEGRYQARIVDADDQTKASFEFTVDFLQRLEALRIDVDFPQFKTDRFYQLQGHWMSEQPLTSLDEVDIAYRFRRPNGDYAWEVDFIPQPLSLELPRESEFSLQVLTPKLPGPYELELWFTDNKSGRRVKMKSSIPVQVDS